MRELIKDPVFWAIYMIKVDNKTPNSLFYGQSEIYYTGITQNIGRRIGDYLYGRGLGFVNRTWKNAIKIPVFVKYFFGTELEAMEIERKIKKLDRVKKNLLIKSKENSLVGYKPCRYMILKKNGSPLEEVLVPVI